MTESNKNIIVHNTPLLIGGLLLIVVALFFIAVKPIGSHYNKLQAKKLSHKLQSKYSGNNWSLNRIPNPELIDNKKGVYYRIDLEDAIHKDVLKFDMEEYVLEDLDERFGKGISDFADKVTDIMFNAKVDYEIFIIGSADQDMPNNGLLKKELDPRYSGSVFRNIKYFEKLEGSESMFHSKEKQHVVSSFFTNQDLPNLRAAFLKYKLMATFKLFKEPTILEGSVKEQLTDEKERNVTLILFAPENFIYPKLKN